MKDTVGVAARDIKKGEMITYDPSGNTGDVITKTDTIYDSLKESIQDLSELKCAYVLEEMKPDVVEIDGKNGIYQISQKLRLRIRTIKENRKEALQEYKEGVKDFFDELDKLVKVELGVDMQRIAETLSRKRKELEL